MSGSREVRLFLASFASLFFELLFIRWIPDSIHILSFFGNFTLLAVFLGLGIGLALPSRNQNEHGVLSSTARNLLLLGAVLLIFDSFKFGVPFSGEYAFNEDYFTYRLHINIYLIIFLILALTINAFIPIGRLIALSFSERNPLVSYSLNIGGSLAGILVFTYLTSLSTPLWLWTAVGVTSLAPFARSKWKFAAAGAASVIIVFAANAMSERQMGFRRIWSPYYCLRLTRYSADHTNITIGNSFIMSALNIYGSGEETGKIAEYYEMPYRCGKTIREVLILGAGMGNDIAAALHNGAVHVDAVEIDPRIVALGRSCHPLKPYDDPRVTVIINDARSWTKQTKGKYDLIVFATLDSHGLFSQLSSLKMENYVYTRESFEEAKALLEEDGLLYVNTGFYGTVFVNHRIYQCLRQVFGKEPRYFLACDSILMYLTSKGEIPDADFSRYRFKRLSVDEGRLRRDSPGAFILPTDDWPHLFLAEKRIPREYLFALAVLLAVSALFVRLSFGPARAFDFNYFFLGAGFMLLETKSITEMGLVFGATWLVNSVVITSVLLIILAVNITLLKIDRFNNIYIPYALLGLCLASAYLTPLGALNIESLPIKIILASAYIGIPVGLASVIFALNFRTAGEQAVPCLGSNMIGAVFGGIAEYFSMVWGLKSLHLLAAGFYLAAMAAMMLQRRRAS